MKPTTFKDVHFSDGSTGSGLIVKLEANGLSRGLRAADEPRLDAGFPGCEYRMPLALCNLAVNLKVTGKTCIHSGDALWVRGQIEYVGDGEPSTFGKVLVRVS